MSNKTQSIGPYTGLLKPKYRNISLILGEDFYPTNGVDIFIDLNTLVSASSTAQKYINSLPFSENVESDIISSILMIVKHWKDFSRKWDNTRIILFFNDFEMGGLAEQSHLNAYLVPYVNKFTNDRLKQYVYYWNESIKRVETILKYVPNSYLIRCNRFDSFVVPNIIDDYEKTKRHRIIITGSSLMTNYCYMPRTHLIYSRYKKTGMYQISDPLMIVQSIAKIDDDIMKAFVQNKVFYNMLNAIIGDFDRGLIGLTQVGISKFASNLLRAVEKREIPEDPIALQSVLPAVDKPFHDYLIKSYPLIDIETHTSMIPQSQIENIKSTMIDLYDIDGLRSLSVGGLNLLELV